MPDKDRNRLIFFVLLVFLAGGLRLWGLGSPSEYEGDEPVQVPVAKHYVVDGQTNDTIWHHPPFGILLLGVSIDVFGDNPYGWRMRNAVLGSLSAALFFLLVRELLGNIRVAFFSGLLMALDPLSISLSRLTFDEIPAVFFFLLGMFLVLRFLKQDRRLLVPAGIAFGLSVSSKSYYVPGVAVLFFFCLLHIRQKGHGGLQEMTNLTLAFIVVPVTVFILSFFPWFGRGYSLPEFIGFQMDSFSDLASMSHEWFKNDIYLRKSGSPLGWFVVPKIFGMQVWREGGLGVFNFSLNNPPVWLLAWPATALFFYRARKEKDRLMLLWLIIFLTSYLPLILTDRPIFLYSAIAMLPFAFSAIAFFVDTLAVSARKEKLVYPTLIVVLFLWSVYMYPLVTFKKVPVSLYQPLMAFARVYHAF